MDQDRREAQLWAEEWKIKQRNRRILRVVLALVLICAIGVGLHYVGIMVARMTFNSAEEMKTYLQGRYETDYAEDIVIEGDTVTLTYYNPSHTVSNTQRNTDTVNMRTPFTRILLRNGTSGAVR